MERLDPEWHEKSLAAARNVRSAVEQGDISKAEAALEERRYAACGGFTRAELERHRQEAHAAAYPDHYDEYGGLGSGSDDEGEPFLRETTAMRDIAALRQVEELGLSPDRALEFRTALALGETVQGLLAADGALAILLGTSLPHWPRFWAERDHWRADGSRPAMLHPLLVDTDPDLSWQPSVMAKLSFDARQVLCYSTLVRRRIAVSRTLLVERTLLPLDRLDRAIAELHHSGLAAVPSMSDRLATLTVADLKVAHAVFGLSGKGLKPVLLEALGTIDDFAIRAFLVDHYPYALETDITVGIGAGKAANWLIAYATLMAYWFTLGLLPAAANLREGCAGWWTIDKIDDCPVCADAPSRVSSSSPGDLPPFHIGCRCGFYC